MNLYDFDKTIYKKDSSIKFYFYCFWRTPKMFFHLFYVLFWSFLHMLHVISTKKFKEKYFSFLKYIKNLDETLENFWNKEIKNINKWYLDQKRDDDVVCSASPDFLVKRALEKINPSAIVICTEMDMSSGKITGENLKGEEKCKQLNLLFGDACKFNAVYTDSLSDFPILDKTENKFIVCGKRVYEFGKQKPTFFVKLKYWIKQLRLKQYIKNCLIFLPLIFSGNFSNSNYFLKTLYGFFALCLIASTVYIINDLIDAKNDRLHSKKRKRPIASYMIKNYEAIIGAVILFAGSFAINFAVVGFDLYTLLIFGSYFVINILYSLWLKNVPIVDVFMLASCYIIRVFYGAVLISVPVSKWLYLTILCAALFMGYGKRRNEISRETQTTRKVNKLYNYNFLDKNMHICLALCLVFYSLWAIDFNIFGFEFLNNKLLLVSIPLVYFIMMRYSFVVEKPSSSGDPTDVLFKDVVLILSAVLFVAIMLIAVYVPIPNIFLR